jgi:hypothetical protein
MSTAGRPDLDSIIDRAGTSRFQRVMIDLCAAVMVVGGWLMAAPVCVGAIFAIARLVLLAPADRLGRLDEAPNTSLTP